MTNLTLRLGNDSFRISTKAVLQNCELFDSHPELFDEPLYAVESDVDVDDLRTFVEFFQTQDSSLGNAENCRALGALADEFGFSALFELCSELDAAQMNANLANRVLVLEDSVQQQSAICESHCRDSARTLSEFVAAVSEQIQSIRTDFGKMIDALDSKIERLNSRTQEEQLLVKESVEASIERLSSDIEELKQFKSQTDQELEFAWTSIHGPYVPLEGGQPKVGKKPERLCLEDLEKIDKVIANDTTREMFSQFLKKRACHEVLEFYLDVLEFRKMDPTARRQLGPGIGNYVEHMLVMQLHDRSTFPILW
jgi:hypothetical protein